MRFVIVTGVSGAGKHPHWKCWRGWSILCRQLICRSLYWEIPNMPEIHGEDVQNAAPKDRCIWAFSGWWDCTGQNEKGSGYDLKSCFCRCRQCSLINVIKKPAEVILCNGEEWMMEAEREKMRFLKECDYIIEIPAIFWQENWNRDRAQDIQTRILQYDDF